MRFTSLPISEHLELPATTPSALIIGIILKINRFLSSHATLSLLSKNLMIPWTIQEALLSPGCTLPVNTIIFFLASSAFVWLKSVTVSIGTSMPAKVWVNSDVSTTLNELSLTEWSLCSSSLIKSLYSCIARSYASCICDTKFVTILKV